MKETSDFINVNFMKNKASGVKSGKYIRKVIIVMPFVYFKIMCQLSQDKWTLHSVYLFTLWEVSFYMFFYFYTFYIEKRSDLLLYLA